jgi:hypothetical protein
MSDHNILGLTPFAFPGRKEIEAILRAHCAGASQQTSGDVNFDLNSLSLAENAQIFIGDVLKHIFNTNKAFTTGSIRFHWDAKQIDCCGGKARVVFIAKDALRLGSATRIPGTQASIIPSGFANFPVLRPTLPDTLVDQPFGPNEPLNTVDLEWHWNETLKLKD